MEMKRQTTDTYVLGFVRDEILAAQGTRLGSFLELSAP